MARGTVLVTGSSGYLGYAITKRMAEKFAVVGFDRRAPSHPPPSADCLYVDLTSDVSVERGLDALAALHGKVIASVIHLAAYYDFSGAPSRLYDQVTVGGTSRLIRVLRSRGFRVEQLVFASTMLVHAPTTPGRPIGESWPLQPKWPYPASKVRTEELIRRERGEIPTVILRIAGVYDDIGHSAPLPRQIQRIFEHDPTARLFPGDLSHGQAMIHRDDVVDLYAGIVERRAALPDDLVLEIGEPEVLSYGELQRVLGRLIHGRQTETVAISKTLAKAGAWLQGRLPLGPKPFIKPWMIDIADDHFELDISQARAVLDWQPRRRLRDTLPAIVGALGADPWVWYRENDLEAPVWLTQMAPRPTGSGPPAIERLDKLLELVGGGLPAARAVHA